MPVLSAHPSSDALAAFSPASSPAGLIALRISSAGKSPSSSPRGGSGPGWAARVWLKEGSSLASS